MAEQKVTSVYLLRLAMQNLLPSFHSVRVALLDSLEDSKSADYNFWYQLQPEPRRLWLTIQSRFQHLADTQATSGALVTQLLQSTNVRIYQTLESVIAFTVCLEAEVNGIVMDASTRSQPQVASAALDASKRPPGPTP
eukprot:6470481-Amphidinium_carterae.1